MQLELSKSQCDNLIEMIEWHLFDWIRADEEIDNFIWVVEMVNTWKALKAGVENAN